MKNNIECKNCGYEECRINEKGLCPDCDQQEPIIPKKCTECGQENDLIQHGYDICNNCLYNYENEDSEKEIEEEDNYNDNDYYEDYEEEEEEEDDEYDYNCRPSWGGVSWGQPGDGYPIYDG